MKQNIYILLTFMILLTVTACQEDESYTNESGFVVSLSDGVEAISTRATPSELGNAVASNFNLIITKDITGATIYDGSYTSGVIKASAGDYMLTATCGDNSVLAWDEPYYEGDANATVEEGMTTSVDIECSVANCLLSIQFEDSENTFDELYSEYGVKVQVGSFSLNYEKADETANKSAYFQDGSVVTLTFYATLQDNGKEVSMVIENDNLPATYSAGTHTILTLTSSTQTPGVILDVDKVEVETVTVTETIPLNWLPAPKVSGFGDNNVLTYTETEECADAVVSYTTSAALQDIEFTLAFEDEQYTSYNDTYTLSEMTTEQITALSEIGIVLPTIDGSSTSGSIDLSALAETLLTNGGETVTNTITVNVKANNRWSSEDDNKNKGEGDTYTIEVVKPVFGVTVYPGNIWTKEFTVTAFAEDDVTTGSYDKLNADMAYQYSEDGTSWEILSDGLRQDELTPETSYYVRGLYRGAVPGTAISLSTYPLTTLTNGSLDEYTSEGEDGNAFANYGMRYFWDGWSTLNELTCDKCTWTAYAYNTRSGTRPTDDSVQGYAVWIATIGWGYGGTIWSTVYQTPGELFLGTVTVDRDEDEAETTYGIDYDSHPTSISFYYKYTPYDDDTSDIYAQVCSDDVVLGSASLAETTEVSSYQAASLTISYDQDVEKLKLTPNKLVIVFKSGTNDSVKNYGSDGLNSVRFVGSQLYIDEVALVYDK